jgi:hypothetical protein
MNLRFIETILWVAFYFAFALFALTADTAPPIYRAIFIDRTTTDWLPGASRIYVPSERILGSENSPFFARGWWGAGAKCRWGSAERSTVVVEPTRSISRGGRLRGNLAVLLGGTRTSQTIGIEVDGIEVTRLEFKATEASAQENVAGENIKMFDAEIPSPIAIGEAVVIAFVVPGASSPFLIQARDDSRTRSVCLYELALVP